MAGLARYKDSREIHEIYETQEIRTELSPKGTKKKWKVQRG